MSNWKVMKLSEVATIVGGGTPSSSKSEYFENGNIPWITPKDLSGYNKRYISKGERNITELGLKNSSAKLLPKNTVLLTSRAPIGYVTIASNEISTNQGFKSLVLNDSHIPEFFYYLLKNNVHILESRATGSTFKEISGQILKDTELSIPTPDIQQKIVDILSPLDDKIELNTQINQTLEQIAQALFKSWFVDFDPVRAKVQALSDGLSLEQAELAAMQAISGKTAEELTALSQTQPDRYAELAEIAKVFPCEMVEIDGVEVPKGWEYKLADELFDIGIGKTPPRKETEWFSTNPDDMQWISIKDMGNSGVFITESSEFLTNQAVDKFNIRKIPENTVLLSFKLTIGRVSITTCETTTNEAIAHFKITNKSFLTTEYLYLFFQQFDFNSLGSTSSIATAVNSKTIKGIEILIPNEELIKAFQMKISNIFAQIKNLTMENKNLVETRDLLLPKLLNGEI